MSGCVVKFETGRAGGGSFVQYYLVAIDDPAGAALAVSAGLQETREKITTAAPVAQQVLNYHGMRPGDVGSFPVPVVRKRHY